MRILYQHFKREDLSPRSPFPSLTNPKHGFGSWCHVKATFAIDDSGLRASAAKNNGLFILANVVPISKPSAMDVQNLAIVSQWDNHPSQIKLLMSGHAQKLYLLMTGSTNRMQNHFDNSGTWWRIHTDNFIDDYAFLRPVPQSLCAIANEVLDGPMWATLER